MKNAPAVHYEERLRRCEECADAHNDESRKPFGLRPSLSPAAIYSRGTYRPTTIDVLMFHFRVRNGTGWDHQAMTTGLLIYFVRRISYFVLQLARLSRCCGMFWWWWRSSRLTSAWQCVGFITISFALRFHTCNQACHRG